jgi:hypothetical protein
MNSLFHLSQELITVFENIESTEQNQSELILKLNEMLSTKVDNVVSFHKFVENHLDLIDSQIKELKERKETINNKLNRLNEYVLACLNSANKKEFTGSIYKIQKVKCPASVEIFDEDKIPLDYIKVPEPKPTIMKDEIKKALKAGEIIEGARLIENKETLKYKAL